jgi:hypothetical protein
MISPEKLADQVLARWSAHSDRKLGPADSEALVIPQLVIDVLGLPGSCFDAISQIWDEQLHKAIAETIAQARAL